MSLLSSSPRLGVTDVTLSPSSVRALHGVKYFVIEQSDVCAGFDVLLKKLIIVLCKYHAAGSDHDIILGLTADIVDVREQCVDICVVDGIDQLFVGNDDLDSAALGVDVVVTAGADVGYQGAGLLCDINLDIIDSAVAEVGDREIDHTESAEEGESADRTIVLHTINFMLR